MSQGHCCANIKVSCPIGRAPVSGSPASCELLWMLPRSRFPGRKCCITSLRIADSNCLPQTMPQSLISQCSSYPLSEKLTLPDPWFLRKSVINEAEVFVKVNQVGTQNASPGSTPSIAVRRTKENPEWKTVYLLIWLCLVQTGQVYL